MFFLATQTFSWVKSRLPSFPWDSVTCWFQSCLSSRWKWGGRKTPGLFNGLSFFLKQAIVKSYNIMNLLFCRVTLGKGLLLRCENWAGWSLLLFRSKCSIRLPLLVPLCLISASSHEINNTVRFVVSWWFGVRPLCLLIYRTASSGSTGLLPYDLHGMNREETCIVIWLQRGGPQIEFVALIQPTSDVRRCCISPWLPWQYYQPVKIVIPEIGLTCESCLLRVHINLPSCRKCHTPHPTLPPL